MKVLIDASLCRKVTRGARLARLLERVRGGVHVDFRDLESVVEFGLSGFGWAPALFWEALGDERFLMDFSGLVIGDLTLDGFDFSGSIWEQGELHEIAFEGCDFTGANFDGALLKRVSFVNCAFEGCNFGSSVWFDCRISESVFANCGFANALMRSCQGGATVHRNCSFVEADWIGASWSHSEWSECLFNGVRWSDGEAFFCGFIGCDFERSRLHGGDLDGVEFCSVNFAAAELESVQFKYHCSLSNCDFDRARLDVVSFDHYARGEGVSFANARLGAVDLGGLARVS